MAALLPRFRGASALDSCPKSSFLHHSDSRTRKWEWILKRTSFGPTCYDTQKLETNLRFCNEATHNQMQISSADVEVGVHVH